MVSEVGPVRGQRGPDRAGPPDRSRRHRAEPVQHGQRGADDVLDYCEHQGIGFIPWFPLGSGSSPGRGGPLDTVADQLGATTSQVRLAWLLRRSPVMLPIPGTSSLDHLEENCAAAAVTLSDAQFES